LIAGVKNKDITVLLWYFDGASNAITNSAVKKLIGLTTELVVAEYR